MPTVNLSQLELPYETNEELKLLRTNLLFCGTDKQVILMTSAFAGEGKSTIALELCYSLVDLGKSVLLIDADLRKSVLRRKVNGTQPQAGLSHYLSGQCDANAVVCRTNIRSFSIVFSGTVPPNPAELLSSQNMQNLIELGRAHFDYVIIDSPPIGMVVDSAVIAPLCDGSVVLIEAGEVRYRLAQEVIGKMKTTGCPILGVVLNKVEHKRSGRYYGRYYGKKYKGYYE